MGFSKCLTLAAAAHVDPSTGTVVAAGLVIVFAVLVLLYLLISLEGVIFSAIDGKKKQPRPAAPTAPAAPAAPAAPVVEQGIPAEVVAAISAAIASMEDGASYTIRSLTRAKKGRSAWGGAGVASYTEPF